jgi:hypothetical protein
MSSKYWMAAYKGVGTQDGNVCTQEEVELSEFLATLYQDIRVMKTMKEN